MSDSKHTQLRRLFDQALERPVHERSAWLDAACGDDRELKRRIEAMLVAAADDRFLSMPTGPSNDAAKPGGAAAAAEEGPGAHIGPYKLLQQIGEGGFGIVFLAEQERPVVRRVALKVIKLGMDTRQVVARFEQERQALAMMDHPHIARVLDAGATATGRPYFVMDLVKGAPIVEYCDGSNLSIAERLELFGQVCGAVQHAHGKGIIHRDIKPSNILVGSQDGRPTAKVIDFGIAKATSQKLTDKTLFTEHQQVIGTLQYMSPEQAEGSLDIDTRTDVYSLGVVLYELLTGSTPFDRTTVQGVTFGELQRLIRETDPPRPSTRVNRSREALVAIAARRRTEPKRLGASLRGELDWIVMKAIEKDRGGRYETASGLAMDIRRHLDGQPVVAAPPRVSYRVRKFVSRYRGVVAAAAAVALALLIGVVGFAWQAAVANDERDKAVEAKNAEAQQRALAEAQKAETKARADELKLVADFQAGVLDQIDATKAGIDLTADVMARFVAAVASSSPRVPADEQAAQVESFRKQWLQVNATDIARAVIDGTILKPTAAAIDQRFRAQPLVAARLQQALALRYQKLGLYEAALPLQQAALETRRGLLGPEHEDTLGSLAQLASLRQAQGKFAEAEGYLREVLVARRRLWGDDHVDTVLALESLGELLWSTSRSKEAEPLLREAEAKLRKLLGDDDPRTLIAINDLGLALSDQNRYAEAEPYYRESLERSRRVLGEDHPDTLVSLNNMGWLLQAQGRFVEAEPFFAESLEKRRRVHGREHPMTLNAINSLGMVLQQQGKLADAEPLLREALAARRRVLGHDHPTTMFSVRNLGILLRDMGQLAEAYTLLAESVEQNRRMWGSDHEKTLMAISSLAILLPDLGRHAEAVALIVPALPAARRTFQGESDVQRVGTLLLMLGKSQARLATSVGELEEAARNLHEALPILERARGAKQVHAVACMQSLADLYSAWERLEPGNGHAAESAAWQARVSAAR